ncbi:MAG: polysaccharide deacetylase family protein [bacterium]
MMMMPRLFGRVFPQWLWRLPSGKRRIALTFDDGPDPVTTPALLDVLKRLEVKATFFLVGERVKPNAPLVERIAAEGHAMANHGYCHENHFGYPMDRLRDSIQRTEESIAALGTRPFPFFRPPYGVFSPRWTSRLHRLHYRGVMWTAHLRDWRPQRQEVLERRARRAFFDGSIVLLHDGQGSSIPTLLKALPQVVEEARTQGFQFVTLGEEFLT